MAALAEFEPPSWVKAPQLMNCGLVVMKDGKVIDKITVIREKACVTFGRNAEMSDVKLDHPSISRRHAMVGHGSSGNIYFVDLESSHGCYINKRRIGKLKREVLSHNDIIKFGASTRQYHVKLDMDYKGPALAAQQSTVADAGAKRPLSEALSTDAPDSTAMEEVECSHLLIKHKDSRRPKSWKESIVTRTKAEALAILSKLRSEIEEKATSEGTPMAEVFAHVATEESHCNSHRKGGSLGRFGRGKMQRPFEDAAFSLAIGHMSDAVETNSGVHIIIRTG